MKLTPRNWATMQHYKERRPPWIKLHRTLLDDYEFSCLQVASRALAPCLWLLAAEYDNGVICGSAAKIAFRMRMTEQDFVDALKPLIEHGFFELIADCEQDASVMLAECKQVATPETEAKYRDKDKETPLVFPPVGGTTQKVRRVREKSIAHTMPPDFKPTADHENLAWSLDLHINPEFTKFCDFHQSKGSKFVDWGKALNTWLRNAPKFTRK